MKRLWIALTVILLLGAPAFCQENFSLSAIPGLLVPLGSSSQDYGIGGAVDITAGYRMPFAPILFAGGGLGLGFTPHRGIDQTITSLALDGRAGLHWTPTYRLGLRAFGGVGYALAFLQDQSPGGSLFFRAGAGFDFFLGAGFKLGLDVDYRQYVSQPDPLWQGLFAGLTLSYAPGRRETQPRLEIHEPRLLPVFPVLYGYYENAPIGTVSLENKESAAISNARVELFVPRFMDTPFLCGQFDRIEKDEVLNLSLNAVFSDAVMDILEGDKASGTLTVTYEFAGSSRTVQRSESFEFHHRNAISWDDDRKAAAFITARDPAVLLYSKEIAGDVREAGEGAVTRNFRIALGLFEGLGEMGIDYVVDPSTPYADFSADAVAVDYMQFPGQTMAYQAGDCDDLTVLYCAVLESVGIETALVTVPGHIYMAFALECPVAEAERLFPEAGQVILRDDKAWVPVEITMVADGFLDAWREAARDWRENEGQGTAAFYPVHVAWNTYPAVGGSDIQSSDLGYPEADAVMAAYRSELESLVKLQISDQEEAIKERINQSGGSPRFINSLGLLYARYGLYDDARQSFQEAADNWYVPAIVNLGNLAYLQRNMDEAEALYRNALVQEPDNIRAALGLSRTLFEQDQYNESRELFQNITQRNPDLAARYAYLGGAGSEVGRAADDGYSEIAEWDGDQ